MPERDELVHHHKITYEGIFSVAELFNIVDDFFAKKSYTRREILNQEMVKPEGKHIEVFHEFYRLVSDYIRKVIQVRLILTNVKEVETTIGKAKVKLNQGKVQIVFNVYLETDWEGRWGSKPIYYVIKTILDKFVFKPFTGGYKAEILDDFQHVSSNIKSFLNLYRYKK